MIVYLDTSAFVPIFIEEPSTPICRQLWNDADTLVTVRLTYVETAAALAMAARRGPLSRRGYEKARSALTDLWADLHVIEVTSGLATRAAELAHAHALRGYDAVHCAAAESIQDDELVAAAGDRALLGAWRRLGISTVVTRGDSGRRGH